MSDQDKSRQQLLMELAEMRQQIAVLKSAEGQRQRSEQRYRLLTEAIPQMLWWADANRQTTENNGRWLEYTGQTPDEARGFGWMKALHPEDVAQTTERLHGARAAEDMYEAEYRLRRASDGSYRWHLSRAIPLKDEAGKITGWFGSVTDIDDQKQAELALLKAHDELEQRVQERTAELTSANELLQLEVGQRRRAEATLNAFFNASTEILNILDSELNYIKTDGLTPSYFGIDSQRMVGRSMMDIAPKLVEKHGVMMRRVIATGESVSNLEVQGEVPTRPGERVYWRTSWFQVPLPEGKWGLGIVGADITDLRRAEEALRQSLVELQTIYDNMTDGLLIADCASGRLLLANPAVCRMLGHSAEELLAMSVRDIHPAEVVSTVLEKIRTQPEGQGILTEGRPTLRKDGTVFYADISNIRISYQGRPCIIGMFRDITERKEAQEALQQAHDELRAIYDQVTDGIIIVDAEAVKPVRANTAYCRMLGYAEEEAYALSPGSVHPPEVLPAVWEHLEAAKSGLVARVDNLPLLRKDGALVYADVVSSQIRYNGFVCIISFFHDVTQRMRAEEALRKEHRTLKHLLQSSDHERQIIAYEIHDELAQQLAGALMQLQTYNHLKDIKPVLAAKAYDAGMTMLQQSHFETRRLIAGVRPPILDESGVVAAISHLVNEQSRLNEPKIEYRCRVSFDRLSPILENAIYRIAQEGLTNACQHSKSEKVRVSVSQRGDWVRVEVRDWGVGFEPTAMQGNRFGMEGIRQRARLLGGKCHISSAPGKGTRLIVELPVMARDEES